MILIVLLATLLLAHPAQGQQSENPKGRHGDESRLYRDLLDGYDQWNPDHVLLPVGNESDTLKMSFGLSLVSFLQYDAAIKVATFHTWHRFAWNDQFLRWDPTEYGGIQTVRVASSRIWKPDIVLFNEFLPSDSFDDALAVVSYDGSVLHIPRVNHKMLCSDNSTNVSCRLKFGSWTFDGFRMGLDFYGSMAEVDVSDYVPNADYDLVGHEAVRHEKYYPCCSEPYIDLTFHLDFTKESSGSWWGRK